MESESPLLWLVPRNWDAWNIAHNEANFPFCEGIAFDEFPQMFSLHSDRVDTELDDFLQRSSRFDTGEDGEKWVVVIRIGFDHQPKGAGLLSFGYDNHLSDIILLGNDNRLSDTILRDKADGPHQADFYIDPNSLDLVCRDYSTDGFTSFLFDDSCERVGNWRAVGNRIVAQAILPSNNTILRFGKARFTILWYHPSMEKEIQGAKRAFLERKLSAHTSSTLAVNTQELLNEAYEKKPLNGEYPEQYDYEPTINILDILHFPREIRYMIFEHVLVKDSVEFGKEWKKRVKKYRTVQGCIEILNLSHQLLNPAFSSRQLAMEAAEVFYRLNHFEIDISCVRSFIWTLKHMPSVHPLDPLSTISRLRLHINCCGIWANPFRYIPYWYIDPLTNPKTTDRWTDIERKVLIHSCEAITSNLPRLTDVEIHIRKEHTCFDSHDTRLLREDADPPIHILKNIKPTIQKLRDLGTKKVKVLLLGRRWDAKKKIEGTPCPNDVITEDITAWWDNPTEQDAEIVCEENLEWLDSIKWQFHYVDEDWERRGLIEGAIMRDRLLKAESDQEVI